MKVICQQLMSNLQEWERKDFECYIEFGRYMLERQLFAFDVLLTSGESDRSNDLNFAIVQS